MRIAMIGGGYVGLVSGACFAEFGIDVTVVEVDAKQARRAARRAGCRSTSRAWTSWWPRTSPPAGWRSPATWPRRCMGAEAVFIAVGTPTRRGDGHADLTYVYAAAEQVARALTGYAVIVTKSTVPVGTGRRIAEIVRASAPGPRVRRRLQPRIPARGQRHRRLHAPRPRGDRRRDRSRARRAAPALPPALPDRGADRVHRHRDGGADQIRRQRLPGDEGHLHQRDGRSVREGRRRRARRGARHRPGRPHRAQVPASRAGLSAAPASPRTRWR